MIQDELQRRVIGNAHPARGLSRCSPLTQRAWHVAELVAGTKPWIANDHAERPLALPERICEALLANWREDGDDWPRSYGEHWPYDCAECGYAVPLSWTQHDARGTRRGHGDRRGRRHGAEAT